MDGSTNVWKALQGDYRTQLEGCLAPDEIILAWFETDLDTRLHYHASVVVLTDRQLLTAMLGQDASNPAPLWHSWLLADDRELTAREHNGVGTLDYSGVDGRIQHWRYTAGRASAAHRFVERFKSYKRQPSVDALLDLNASVCPSCGAVIGPDESECAACVPTAAPPAISSLYRLIRFARPRLPMLLLGFALSVAATAAGLVSIYVTKPLIDNVLLPHEKDRLVDPWIVGTYLGVLGGGVVLAWLLSWAQTYVMAWVSERVSADLRNHTYAHLQRLSLEFFGGKRTGDLMSRISSDSDRLCYFISVHLLDFASDVLLVVMASILLFNIDPVLALLTLCPFPIIAWLIYLVRDRLKRGFLHGGRAWATMTSVLADTIPGVRVVKAFAQEHREIERFTKSNDDILATNDRVNAVWAFFGPMVTLLTEVGLLVIWAFGIWRFAQGAISVGTLTLFIAAIGRFYVRLDSMSRIVTSVQRAAASAQRIFEILDRLPSVPEPLNAVDPGEIRGSVELRGVRFKYGIREVIHGINLSVKPGEMIGLVGASGAGKSTLVNLICRFYDVGEGAILVDGVDIRSYPVEKYRRHIGIVLQEPFLFYGTIAENIAYGRPDATREEIIAAAKAARAHEFILRLPDGYDSLVGERGQTLSGGERQRISIARALLIDPAILILDEATSSVDTETEREIQEALDNLIQGRTTIAIAHRLSTLRKADRLVVMERGKIVEIGPHHQLLKKPGHYARLHKAQMELAHGSSESSIAIAP